MKVSKFIQDCMGKKFKELFEEGGDPLNLHSAQIIAMLLDDIISEDYQITTLLHNTLEITDDGIIQGTGRLQRALAICPVKNTQDSIYDFIYETLYYCVPTLVEAKSIFLSSILDRLITLESYLNETNQIRIRDELGFHYNPLRGRKKLKEDVSRVFNKLGVDYEVVLNGETDIVKAVATNIQNYVYHNLRNFDLHTPTIEGESKKVYRDAMSHICLVELKPTMYSYTHGRYGIVDNVDKLRCRFWKVFSDEINQTAYDSLYLGRNYHSNKVFGLLNKLIDNGKLSLDYPFLTSFLGQVIIDGTLYNVCRFCEDETPLEVVWKNYLVGTMKHRLLNVEKWGTKSDGLLHYEAKLPSEIVRFDWRNPNEYDGKKYCDECIPDDFANFFIDVENAKLVCLAVSNIILEQLKQSGYEFVDTCYFINSGANYVFAEITPDGMRIKKLADSASSFDKDLWRQGKDSATINSVWSKLLKDLEESSKNGLLY